MLSLSKEIAAFFFMGALLGACAPNRGAAYERSLAEARRAAHDGRFDDAAAHFDDAAKSAKVARDGVFARYEAALSRARAGDRARARIALRQLADEKPQTEYSALAALKAADLTLQMDEEAGYRELEAIVLAYPKDGVARVALARILRHDDDEHALEHLESLAPRIVASDNPKDRGVEEIVAYERAKRLADLGRDEAALAALFDVAKRWPYPHGAYFDDALFRASEIERKLGRPQRAIATLEELLSKRETSWMIGTYERPKYEPAILRIAEIYEQDLFDRAMARETLHRFYRDFKTSTFRDDALWREAELWRKDGEIRVSCDRLATLAREFPDSRYVPCASVRCPDIKRPAKSQAPTTCRAYILRDTQAR
ncbi:MAG: tetratricopeptide repeat protein [Polyangiaceae bacterium]|nr:tetratricopeptide repeat protein [Polyangiaceae bacterium]